VLRLIMFMFIGPAGSVSMGTFKRKYWLHELAQRECVGRADEMDRRAHEGDPHCPLLGEQRRDIFRPALGEPGP
jgi:hypothetical protein